MLVAVLRDDEQNPPTRGELVGPDVPAAFARIAVNVVVHIAGSTGTDGPRARRQVWGAGGYQVVAGGVGHIALRGEGGVTPIPG